jgi:hypothetical protein
MTRDFKDAGQLQPWRNRVAWRSDRRWQRRPLWRDATSVGVADPDGTVFEIVKTAARYASTPTTLVGFIFSESATAAAGRIADATAACLGRPNAGERRKPRDL